MATRRTSDEPAFVLHRYDWSESSLILETFTRRHGRIALVAKGAKRPSSNFRPILLPLQPLRIAFGGEAEIRTLKAAEWVGGHVMPTGDALLAGYYLNELLLRLIARDDAHPRLFDAYAETVAVLASEGAGAIEPALRTFELLLLREAGVLPALDVQTLTMAPVEASARYALVPEAGVIAAEPDRPSLSGRNWSAIDSALGAAGAFHALLPVVAPVAADLKPQLRALLHYHCGGGPLRTRQLMMDLQNL